VALASQHTSQIVWQGRVLADGAREDTAIQTEDEEVGKSPAPSLDDVEDLDAAAATAEVVSSQRFESIPQDQAAFSRVQLESGRNAGRCRFQSSSNR
jgi:hypothetical protein